MALSATVPSNLVFRASSNEMILTMPIKSGVTIYEGAALEFNGGYVEPVSGAGQFAGFACANAVGGGSDGLNSVQVRISGLVELVITTDTPAQSQIGVNANFIEATDDNTFRVETGSAITGTSIGRPLAPLAGNKMLVSFKAAHLT
jgi:hypothetical protein